MKFSLNLGIALLLTIAASAIVQAGKSEETCGNLGSGTYSVYKSHKLVSSSIAILLFRATHNSHAISQGGLEFFQLELV